MFRNSLDRSSPRRTSLRRSNRRGAIVTVEMIIALPVIAAFALTTLQMMLIGSAHYRVQAAAIAAAEKAATGASIDEVHTAAGLMLGPRLAELYQTEMEYSANGKVDDAEPGIDHVNVSVRIPMLAAGRNYLGLFGGDISTLHIRAWAGKEVTKKFKIGK